MKSIDVHHIYNNFSIIYKDVEILAIEYEDEFLGIIWNALAADEFAADLIHAEE
jgi:hypothetical protein